MPLQYAYFLRVFSLLLSFLFQPLTGISLETSTGYKPVTEDRVGLKPDSLMSSSYTTIEDIELVLL